MTAEICQLVWPCEPNLIFMIGMFWGLLLVVIILAINLIMMGDGEEND